MTTTTKTSISRAASILGRAGGSVASDAQRAAARRNGIGGGRPRMIYVVEIPHQAAPRAISDTEKRIIAHYASAAASRDYDVEVPEGVDIETFDPAPVIDSIDAVDDYLSVYGALHSHFVFRGTTEARRALRDEAAWHGHQGIAARAALRELLSR